MDISNLITTREAAALLGVSTGYIRRLMREDKLRYYFIPGSTARLLSRSAVLRFTPRKPGRPKISQVG